MGVDFLENSFSPHSFCCVVFYVEDIMDQNFMKENHLDVRSSYHVVDDLSTVVMVANGFGICLMPEMVMKDIPYEVDCFPVKPDACRIIGIAALNPDNMAPAVRTFYNRVLAMYQQEEYVK